MDKALEIFGKLRLGAQGYKFIVAVVLALVTSILEAEYVISPDTATMCLKWIAAFGGIAFAQKLNRWAKATSPPQPKAEE